jgi:hypothetical protein
LATIDIYVGATYSKGGTIGANGSTEVGRDTAVVPRTSTTLVSGGTVDEIFVGGLIELTFVPLVETFEELATSVEDPLFPSNIAVRIPARARSPSSSSSQGLQQDFSYLGRGAGGEIDVLEAPAY